MVGADVNEVARGGFAITLLNPVRLPEKVGPSCHAPPTRKQRDDFCRRCDAR
jgi:hypothetical protein